MNESHEYGFESQARNSLVFRFKNEFSIESKSIHDKQKSQCAIDA